MFGAFTAILNMIVIGGLSWHAFKQSEKINADLKRVQELEDIVDSFVRNEIPAAEIDDESPGDFVVFRASHMDWEGYRYALRLAREAIGYVQT